MALPPLVVGGVPPAVLLGVTTVLTRFSIGPGATVAAVGGTAFLTMGRTAIGWRASGFAVAMGLCWSGAIACISYGFGTLKLTASVVAPLTNSNALIAVILGSLLLSEWKTLNMP